MSDNIDSEIEKKKKELKSNNDDKSIAESLWSLVKTILIFVILVLILTITGSFYLFTAKVGQSNILPTEKNCMPYEGNPPDITPIDINVNVTDYDGERQSQKVQFSYKDNSGNTFLDFLRKITENPLQSGITMYFTTIFQDLTCLNYKMINSIYNFINNVFSESMIIFLVPILSLLIGPAILLVLFLINYVYFYYNFFSKLSWFFKKNTNKDRNLKPVWSDIGLTSEPVSYIISLMLVFAFIIFLFITLFIPIPIVGGIITLILLYVGLTPLFMVGTKSNKKDYTFFSSIIDIFKYHLTPIMYIFTFLTIILTFSNLGWIAGLFSILAFILIYLELIPIPIYNSSIPPDLSPVTVFEQAKKTCSFVPPPEPSQGLLSKLSKFLKFTGGQSGGGKKSQIGLEMDETFENSIKKIKKLFK